MGHVSAGAIRAKSVFAQDVCRFASSSKRLKMERVFLLFGRKWK